MNIESARKILDERGLVLDNNIIEKYDNITPEGYVISQIPLANSVIKEGRHISVTVSKGEEEMIVPNLIRVSLRQAQLLLESSNLVLGTVERRFYDVDSSAVDTTAPNADSLLAPILEDYIISQNPLPETKVQRGSAVNISISLGSFPKAHKMPNLVGRPYGDIWPWINVYKLKVASVSNEYAENIVPNTVLKQKPPAGSDITDGEEIHLILSTDTKP
jgi:serine/threonine-protein kinase